jgi:hypothetical protein
MNVNEWREECNYISDTTDNMRRGKLGIAFNSDPKCFVRYLVMQRDSAKREGFDDAAQYIQHCIDDAELHISAGHRG